MDICQIHAHIQFQFGCLLLLCCRSIRIGALISLSAVCQHCAERCSHSIHMKYKYRYAKTQKKTDTMRKEVYWKRQTKTSLQQMLYYNGWKNTFCWLEHGELMDKSAFKCNRFEINDIQTNRFFQLFIRFAIANRCDSEQIYRHAME